MCGRFTQVDLSQFTNFFSWINAPDEAAQPRFNIAPTQAIAVVPNMAEPRIEFYQWGLVPSWAKDPSIGSRMINARAESLAQKNAFKTPLKRRRCLVPADGFYEWRKNPDRTKTPMYITLRSGRPMAFAGLWDVWHDPGGSDLATVTIITTDANDLIAPIHDRMPAILPEEAYRLWLTPGEMPPEQLTPLLRPFDPSQMQVHPVSRLVNSPANESAECIAPIQDVPPAPKRKTPCRPDTAQGKLFPDA